ncbi:MAG: hypothetical protein ABI992_08845 [Chthoniobacterales bacterium]
MRTICCLDKARLARWRWCLAIANYNDDFHLVAGYLVLATRWAIWESRGFPAKRLATSATDDIYAVRRLIES